MEIVTKFVKQESATTGIGAKCRELIKLGKTNQEILDTIKAEFPSAKTTVACVAWYKADMRKKGLLAPKGHKTVYVVNGVEYDDLELAKAASMEE